jgi:hypothetical protein
MANETDSIVPWLIQTLNIETGSKMLVTFIAIFGALWATFPVVSRFVRVKRAVYVLSRATLCTGLPTQHLLPRPGLLNSLKNALDDPNFNSVLVYGVRGSGKTTAINKALDKRLAVVAWTMAAEEGTAATAELKENWRSLFSPWSRPEDRAFDEDVCRRIVANCDNPLVVVILVETSTSPSALKSLLHFCKTMS